MDNYNIIREVIKKKGSLSGTYEGFYREFSPHKLGMGKHGQMVLIYQFGGTSSSGRLGWKCMLVNQIRNLSKINGWYTGTTKGGKQTCVKTIDVQVNI